MTHPAKPVSRPVRTPPPRRDARFVLEDPEQRAFDAASSTAIEYGLPVERRVKTILRVGDYVHPSEGWTFNVTLDRLKELAATFTSMREHGVDCNVVKDHSFTATDHLGFVTDMWVEGDSLVAIHELRGEQAIDLAKRLPRTSVWIEKSYRDGEGRVYGEAIVHNSISQDPVVPGMHDEFVPVPDDLGGGRAAVLSRRFAASDNNKECDMNLTPETLRILTEKLGVKELGDEKALLKGIDAIVAGVAETAKKIVDLEAAVAKAAESEAAAVAKATEALKVKREIDPEVAELVATTVESIAASCVEKGRLTPATAKTLSELLIGAEGTRNGFALSRSATGGRKPLAMAVFQALADNDVVALGEMTREQVIGLARVIPGGKGDADIAAVTAAMLVAANAKTTAVL